MEKTFKVNIIEDSKAAAMKVMPAVLRSRLAFLQWLSGLRLPHRWQMTHMTWLAWPA